MESPDITKQESHSRWYGIKTVWGSWETDNGKTRQRSVIYSYLAKLIVCCLVRRDGKLIPKLSHTSLVEIICLYIPYNPEGAVNCTLSPSAMWIQSFIVNTSVS